MQAYITIATSESYIPGIVALKMSLKETGTKIPFLIFTKEKLRNKILDVGFKDEELLIYDKSLKISEDIINQNGESANSHWNLTFDKLLLFSLEQFSKLVFLDSDMMVCKNIDELFQKPHMSAVFPSLGNLDYTRGFNSGLMVINPVKGLGENIFSRIQTKVFKNNGLISISDNDLLIDFYSNWGKDKEQILDDTYNLFYPYLNEYINNGIQLKDIKVVHFIGKEKIWMKSSYQIKKELEMLIMNDFCKYEILSKYLNFLGL